MAPTTELGKTTRRKKKKKGSSVSPTSSLSSNGPSHSSRKRSGHEAYDASLPSLDRLAGGCPSGAAPSSLGSATSSPGSATPAPSPTSIPLPAPNEEASFQSRKKNRRRRKQAAPLEGVAAGDESTSSSPASSQDTTSPSTSHSPNTGSSASSTLSTPTPSPGADGPLVALIRTTRSPADSSPVASEGRAQRKKERRKKRLKQREIEADVSFQLVSSPGSTPPRRSEQPPHTPVAPNSVSPSTLEPETSETESTDLRDADTFVSEGATPETERIESVMPETHPCNVPIPSIVPLAEYSSSPMAHQLASPAEVPTSETGGVSTPSTISPADAPTPLDAPTPSTVPIDASTPSTVPLDTPTPSIAGLSVEATLSTLQSGDARSSSAVPLGEAPTPSTVPFSDAPTPSTVPLSASTRSTVPLDQTPASQVPAQGIFLSPLQADAIIRELTALRREVQELRRQSSQPLTPPWMPQAPAQLSSPAPSSQQSAPTPATLPLGGRRTQPELLSQGSTSTGLTSPTLPLDQTLSGLPLAIINDHAHDHSQHHNHDHSNRPAYGPRHDRNRGNGGAPSPTVSTQWSVPTPATLPLDGTWSVHDSHVGPSSQGRIGGTPPALPLDHTLRDTPSAVMIHDHTFRHPIAHHHAHTHVHAHGHLYPHVHDHANERNYNHDHGHTLQHQWQPPDRDPSHTPIRSPATPGASHPRRGLGGLLAHLYSRSSASPAASLVSPGLPSWPSTPSTAGTFRTATEDFSPAPTEVRAVSPAGSAWLTQSVQSGSSVRSVAAAGSVSDDVSSPVAYSALAAPRPRTVPLPPAFADDVASAPQRPPLPPAFAEDAVSPLEWRAHRDAEVENMEVDTAWADDSMEAREVELATQVQVEEEEFHQIRDDDNDNREEAMDVNHDEGQIPDHTSTAPNVPHTSTAPNAANASNAQAAANAPSSPSALPVMAATTPSFGLASPLYSAGTPDTKACATTETNQMSSTSLTESLGALSRQSSPPAIVASPAPPAPPALGSPLFSAGTPDTETTAATETDRTSSTPPTESLSILSPDSVHDDLPAEHVEEHELGDFESPRFSTELPDASPAFGRGSESPNAVPPSPHAVPPSPIGVAHDYGEGDGDDDGDMSMRSPSGSSSRYPSRSSPSRSPRSPADSPSRLHTRLPTHPSARWPSRSPSGPQSLLPFPPTLPPPLSRASSEGGPGTPLLTPQTELSSPFGGSPLGGGGGSDTEVEVDDGVDSGSEVGAIAMDEDEDNDGDNAHSSSDDDLASAFEPSEQGSEDDGDEEDVRDNRRHARDRSRGRARARMRERALWAYSDMEDDGDCDDNGQRESGGEEEDGVVVLDGSAHPPGHALDLLAARYPPKPGEPIKGFHLSSEGGMAKVAQRYYKLRQDVRGALSVQHFVGSPKCCTRKPLLDTQVGLFRTRVGKHSRNWTVHASHATNLVSEKESVARQAFNDIRIEMENCNALGIPTLCIHLGEAPKCDVNDNINRVVPRLRALLDKVPDVTLALENMVRQSSKCGGAWGLDAIRKIIERVNSDRIKACVDICHAYIAHYDFFEAPEAVDKFVADVKALGPDGVAGFHVSDSFSLHGTHCDGHANLGQGYISLDVFRRILRDPDYLGKVPYYLETPNYACVRPRDHAEIEAKEMERRYAEWELLERVICTPDDEWSSAQCARLQKTYDDDRTRPEERIRHIIKTIRSNSKQGQFNGIVDQFDTHRKRVRMLRAQVSRARQKRDGRQNALPTEPRKSMEMLAMEESFEFLGDEERWDGGDDDGLRYCFRRREPRKAAYNGSGGRALPPNEYASAAVGTRSSTRLRAAAAAGAASPYTPGSTGGGGGGVGRTRSGLVQY